jgi:DNA-binding NarL/FixJ family response regulator
MAERMASWQMSDSAKKIRVILVDDHPAVLRQTIQLLPECYEVVETLQDGTELQAAVRDLQPDILVIDITLPVVGGVELVKRLRAAGFLMKVIFLTVHADPDYAWEAFNAGALGYVVKPRLASDLVPALEAVLAGERFISPCAELASVA